MKIVFKNCGAWRSLLFSSVARSCYSTNSELRKIRDCWQSSLIRNTLTPYALEAISLILEVGGTCVLNEALHDISLFNRCVSRT